MGFLGLGFPTDAGSDIHILINHPPAARHADREGWQAVVLHATAESQGWTLPCAKSRCSGKVIYASHILSLAFASQSDPFALGQCSAVFSLSKS